MLLPRRKIKVPESRLIFPCPPVVLAVSLPWLSSNKLSAVILRLPALPEPWLLALISAPFLTVNFSVLILKSPALPGPSLLASKVLGTSWLLRSIAEPLTDTKSEALISKVPA